MGKRRPAKCYRLISKKAYIHSRFCKSQVESKLRIYNAGNRKASAEAFPTRVNLVCAEKENISANAMEAARIAANRHMMRSAGKDNYHLRVGCYPLHILRINKMLTCAGADRLQTGMRGSFGKPIGRAIRAFVGQNLMSIRAKEGMEKEAKEALRKAKFKLPGQQKIQVSQIYGFTGIPKEEFRALREDGKIWNISGSTIGVIKPKGSVEDYLYKVSRAID